MPPRKRRRSQAFPESDEDNVIVNEHLVSDTPSADLDRERDVWDSFREEHFEAVDQMPLTLHRHFALMQELDQQVHSYIAQLLPTLQRYISKRREIAVHFRIPAPVMGSNSGVFRDIDVPFKSERLSSPRSLPSLAPSGGMSLEAVSGGHSAPWAPHTSSTTTQTPTPSDHAENQKTTQQMLSHIAWVADELFRASEEKINLVQAAFDSVDRHLRILDQAITEQETSISLGSRSSHLLPANVPEPLVPRSGRSLRVTSSPLDVDEDDLVFAGDVQHSDPILDGVTSEAHALRRSGKKGRLSDREQLFCYCNRPSSGEMVACDNEECETEWFHVDCLELKETPEGTWYCSDKCQATARRKKRK